MMVPETGDVVSTSKVIFRTARIFLGDVAFFVAEAGRKFSSVLLTARLRLGLLS
jgi:hypothetical protein